mgnify:CR=1 FL=1
MGNSIVPISGRASAILFFATFAAALENEINDIFFGDIPLLTNHFTDLLTKEQGLENKLFSPEALQKLKNYPWSGNVRELRNVVERLMILGDNPITSENINQFAPK